MDLHSHQPYWLMRKGIPYTYPSLEKNLKTRTVVMGAGITGALMAWHLLQAGIETVLIEGRHTGLGSTCASTAMLQYEIDVPMVELSKRIGFKKALRSYQLCRDAVDKLEAIIQNEKINCGYRRVASMQFASKKSHVEPLLEEYLIRKNNGFDVDMLNEKDVLQGYGFNAPCALYSPQNSSQVDAYTLTHALVHHAHQKGMQVYENTKIKGVERKKNEVVLHAENGSTITAKELIVTTGYEAREYFGSDFFQLHSTYAMISEPYEIQKFWHKNSLIWETNRPYIYLRTTRDKRIIIGGKDEPFLNPERRDRLIVSKSKALLHAFEKLFPHLPPYKIDFRWAGTFGETPDGLPYIGQIRTYPRTWFALAFGGNGILFSQIAGEFIAERIAGKKNPDEDLFTFSRQK